MKQHNWRRFWCKPEETYSLADAGFLVDPDAAEYGRILQPHAVSFEHLRTIPCLVLLGEPGMGKSTAIAMEQASLVAEEQTAITVELLRDFSTRSIQSALESKLEFQKWKSGDGVLHLFLDALDEGLIRNPDLANDILEVCSSLDTQRLRLRISCRTLEWPTSLADKLRARWSQFESLATYELLPLRRADVRMAATDRGVASETFLDEVIDRDAQPLANRPISLRFLLQTFAIDGRLPQSKLRLYDEGCRLLCADEGTWERGRPTPDAFRRMAVAARLAATGTFTNEHLIVRHDATPTDGMRTSSLVGGVERVHGATYEIDERAIADTLQGSALFSARAENTFGWAHQSYREFLAAWYLAHRNLDLPLVESLYFATPGPVPAPLREVAAWHATFVPALFDALLERDPDVLMKSDTAAVSAPIRRLLVNALLVRMDEFQAHDRNYNYDSYRRLDHPHLAEQLRPFIRDKTKNVVVRRAAIDIAGACSVSDLADDLVAVVRDLSDQMQPRETAARALCSFEQPAVLDLFREALAGSLDPDPDDQILGAALGCLWPKHIDAATLFAALRRPNRSNFSGRYARFLYGLAESIKASDLEAALDWVAQTIDHSELGPSSKLREHIIALAITQLHLPRVASALATIAIRSFARHRDFIGGRTGRSSKGQIKEVLTTERRRQLVAALVTHDAYSEKVGPRLIFNDPPLLRWADLEWLARDASANIDGPTEAAYSRLAAQLYMRFGYVPEASILDTVAEAYDRSPLLREALAPFLAPVELGSQRAASLRTAWERAEENRIEIERRAIAPDQDDETDARVRRARALLEETHDAALWPALYFTMTDRGFGAVIETDVWQRLNDLQREQTRAAARKHLELPSDPDQAWLDTTSIPGSAFAVVGAFSLLVSDVDTLAPEVWRRWVHVLLGLSSNERQTREVLLPRALRHAPEAVSSALTRIVVASDRLHGAVPVLGLLSTPLPISIQEALLSVADTLGDRSWRSVMDLLVRSGNARALELALIALAGQPKRAAVAAHVALPNRPDRWPVVFVRMQRDREFAAEFLDAFADVDDEPSPVLKALDEMGVAELYLTIRRLFPPEDDPKRDNTEMTLVTPRDQIARLRDRLVNSLADHGSVKALQWLVEQLPQAQTLRWWLVEARSKKADQSWNPPSLDKFLRLTGVLVVVTEDDQITLAFELPLSAPMKTADYFRQAVPGLVVSTSDRALHVSGPGDATARLLKMANDGALQQDDNRLLGIRLGSVWLFEAVPPVKVESVKHRNASPEELRTLLDSVDVLVMTATNRETDAVLSLMKPLAGESLLVIGALTIDTYSIGMLGRYIVAHCQSGMGSTAPDGSLPTTCDVIREVTPKVIFLVGIAFGMRPAEQRIGDVLIAKHIRPYAMYKAKPETIEDRGHPIAASLQLTKWMKERTREWRFLRADGSQVQVTPGDVLSGEVLVNSLPFRNWLQDRFPTALGGEMEGIGAYAASERHRAVHMLLVKAICDWADGCKNDRAQPFAAAVAASIVRHFLDTEHILAPLGVPMADVGEELTPRRGT